MSLVPSLRRLTKVSGVKAHIAALPASLNILYPGSIQVRCAGGGGRPGARPTLNWRKRMELRLSKKGETPKKLKMKDFGDFDEDIAPFLDEAKGDVMVDITELEEWDMSSMVGTDEDQQKLVDEIKKADNPYKKIQAASLFGSAKSAGALHKKTNKEKKRFSHKRVFGHA